MGKVCLLLDHNRIREETIFSPEKFQNRIFGETGERLPSIYCNALTAMMNLKNFDFDLWLFDDPDKEVLELVDCSALCRVFFNKTIIAEFSYSSILNENNPFSILFGFPFFPKNDYFRSVKKWTIKQWEEFLIKSIDDELQKSISRAEFDMREKQEKYQKAEEIFLARCVFKEVVLKALETNPI